MGCGCKTDELSGSTETTKKTTFKEKLTKVLERKNSFSIFGVLLFIIILPITIFISIPILTIILFNKLILGKDTDLIKMIKFFKYSGKKVKD